MASTSTSTSYSSAPVSLPSIHEMFPEHLMPRARPARPPASMFPRSHFVSPPPPPASHLTFSFDVLKSDPRGSSLQHIASSRPSPAQHRRQALPAVRTQPPSTRAHSSSGSSDGDAEMDVDGEDGDEGEDSTGAEEGKKHVCPTCAKRFNRPSSLRIHVNTHTGATPFRCPHPSCGRAFNVNSNMRRHFRNHASPSFAGSASSNTSSPISPASSFNSPISPSSYTSSPSASWSPSSTSSSASRFSPKTPLSPLSLPHAWAPAPPKGMHGYSESDVRSERR